ncbi:MAG: BamA/TamA family outer membrane protein [Desulfamplus sp.]|nr:BamA/TamA family outer membrane protein [Desulfamplus sp.]
MAKNFHLTTIAIKLILLLYLFYSPIIAVCYADNAKANQAECTNIKSLVFKGNLSFSDIRLKMRLKSWHSSLLPGKLNCYNEDWLKKDILKLIEFYREAGFPDVGIDHNLKIDSKGRYTVEIIVDEGFKYEIAFKGSHFFSEKELKKKVDLVKKGNSDDIALSRAKVDIKKDYLDAGFQDVEVDFSKFKDNTKQNIWIVEFVINEGVRYVVNQLKIEGNKSISKDEILESMLTSQKNGKKLKDVEGGYNANVLEKDINAIELLYLSKGFLNAKISKEVIINQQKLSKSESDDGSEITSGFKSQLLDIYINISEGVQTIVKTTKINGLFEKLSSSKNGLLTEDRALTKLSLRSGEPFREYMVKSDENTLSMMVSELGYPHVKVISHVKFSPDKSEADLVWEVEKGKFTRFGKIEYLGNKRLKDDVIEKRLEIASGEPFSLRKVLATEKRIRESSAVKYVQVKSPNLSRKEDFADIEIAIEEAKPYFVEAALGYDTEQNLYIDTKVGDNNFLGREIDAWVAAKLSGIGYRFESGLKKPFFLGTKIDATSSIYVEDKEELNKSFGIKSWGYESQFSRYLFIKNLTAGLNLKYENRTVYGDADIEVQDEESRNILITSFALGYDTRDSLVRPSKGLLTSCSVDLYTGFDSDLDRFLKYQVDLRKYISPFNKITFALRTRMGYIQPFGAEDSVAQDQLFFLGGTPNVRGFKENMLEYDIISGKPKGGHTAINSTLEARIDLPADFELNCFLDTGKIDDLSNDLDSRGFRSSVGAGLRYVTPIGPIGLLYGHKLDPEDGESAGRIHFSVGYTF